ncbi:MAG TPA: cobalt transporter CbiM [Gammaproteobacteria bacterium]|nr:cobalt transporter CbiM [Gammaproteobacteria bacterium]
MHISDGVLSEPVLAVGFLGTAAAAAVSLRRMENEEIPKIAVMTSVFFIASLIRVPIGPASIHLILNGLAGVVLGPRAFAAIMLGIVLQAILFGHGGVSVIGVNSLMMGGGALAAYGVWQLRHRFGMARRELVFGALAGATGTVVSGTVLALALVTTGKAFIATAGYVLVAHLPIVIIEAAVTAAAATYLTRVKPEVLAGYRRPPAGRPVS